MKYAPIYIPTLCRFEHFKNCIESLSRCKGANETEVYVALDYPAKEAHKDGYEKIKAYLDSVGNMTFKKLYVIKRAYNCGCGKNGNSMLMRNFIISHYDRYIFSEDDNVFSPNFLIYINACLEKFEENMDIFAICGYTHPYEIRTGDNNYFLQNIDFSAWGYAIWTNRVLEYQLKISKNYFRSKMLNPLNIFKMYRNGFNRLADALILAFGKSEITYTDNVLSVYMALENMHVVMPVVSKVRNEGWDGTGQNCKEAGYIAESHMLRKIDTAADFELKGNGMNFYDENHNSFVKHSYARKTLQNFIMQLLQGFIKRFHL